jgi:hypothetical protein
VQTEQFVWLNKQGVRSRDGFEVQSVGRFTIEYREGRLKVSVDVERGSYGGGSSVSISRNAFKHWDGSSLTNSSDAQLRMRKNFREGLAFMDIELED